MQYSAAHKTATTIVKQSKEKSWEEFGQKLDTDYILANKVFWQTICHLCSKQTPVATFIKDSKCAFEASNHWRKYCCELLNLVTAQYLETSEEQIGEEIHLTKAQVSTAIKSLKAGKSPCKDDI